MQTGSIELEYPQYLQYMLDTEILSDVSHPSRRHPSMQHALVRTAPAQIVWKMLFFQKLHCKRVTPVALRRAFNSCPANSVKGIISFLGLDITTLLLVFVLHVSSFWGHYQADKPPAVSNCPLMGLHCSDGLSVCRVPARHRRSFWLAKSKGKRWQKSVSCYRVITLTPSLPSPQLISMGFRIPQKSRCVCVCMYVLIRGCAYTYICINTCICICVYTCMCVYMCV